MNTQAHAGYWTGGTGSSEHGRPTPAVRAPNDQSIPEAEITVFAEASAGRRVLRSAVNYEFTQSTE